MRPSRCSGSAADSSPSAGREESGLGGIRLAAPNRRDYQTVDSAHHTNGSLPVQEFGKIHPAHRGTAKPNASQRLRT